MGTTDPVEEEEETTDPEEEEEEETDDTTDDVEEEEETNDDDNTDDWEDEDWEDEDWEDEDWEDEDWTDEDNDYWEWYYGLTWGDAAQNLNDGECDDMCAECLWSWHPDEGEDTKVQRCYEEHWDDIKFGGPCNPRRHDMSACTDNGHCHKSWYYYD